MSKLWSTLGTDENLVYAIMGALIVAFIVECVIIFYNTYDNFRYGEYFHD